MDRYSVDDGGGGFFSPFIFILHWAFNISLKATRIKQVFHAAFSEILNSLWRFCFFARAWRGLLGLLTDWGTNLHPARRRERERVKAQQSPAALHRAARRLRRLERPEPKRLDS